MSDFEIVKEACYDIIVDVLDGYVSSPNEHVIRADDDEPETPPMVALSADTRGDQTGIYGSRVIDIETNPYDVVYGEDRIFTLDLSIADVDGSRADAIHDDIQNALTFDNRIRPPQALVNGERPPIGGVNTRDMSPLGRDERVGHVLATEVEYTRTFRHSDIEDPPATVETVVQNFVEGDTVYESYTTS